MKRYIIILIMIVLTNVKLAHSQDTLHTEWFLLRSGAANLGDDAWGVDVDDNGYIYWATNQTLVGGQSYDLIFYKLDSNGNEVWPSPTVYDGPYAQHPFIAQVKDSVAYIAGREWAGITINTSNMLLMAVNINDGTIMWDTTWDRGYGYEEIDGLVIKDDGIYVAGWTEGETTQMDIVLHKLDFNGNFLWTQIWGSNGFDQSDGHMVVDDSVIYLAGRYNGINEIFGGDALLAAFDRVDGNYKWHRTWGGNAMDDALGMAGDDDYLYQVGITSSFPGNNIFILKYDKAGTLQWDTLWGGGGGEKARAITVGDDGYIYVGVNTSSYGAGSDDIALLKCSPNGDPLWYKTWGGAQAEAVHDIVVRNGFAYLTGSTVSYSSNIFPDALLLKASISVQSISLEYNPDNQQSNLYQNFPNPFLDITNISFFIPQDAFVTLKVIDLLGREVNVLVNKKLSKGKHCMTLNLDNLKEGIYFCLLETKNRQFARKLIKISR